MYSKLIAGQNATCNIHEVYSQTKNKGYQYFQGTINNAIKQYDLGSLEQI